MSDDGLGVATVEELRKTSKRYDKVVFVEAGTSLLDYLEEIGKAENVIAVDAMISGNPPGTIYCLDAFIQKSNIELGYSHGCPIPEIFSLSKELTGFPLKAKIYGIEPLNCGPGFNISPEVKTSLKRLIRIIEQDIEYILEKGDIVA